MKIVAFAGMIGSGKSTAAQALIEKGFVSIAFADTVKDVVATIFGLDRKLLEGDTAESREWREQELPFWDAAIGTSQTVTPRFLLQYVATEVFRAHWPDIWVHVLQNKLMQLRKEGKNVVIPDLRFLNEHEMLVSMGAHIIGIHRTSPAWVKDFYRHMELILPDGPHADMKRDVLEHARKSPAIKNKVHESEWQHLLFPYYTTIIHNTGKNVERFKRLVVKTVL